MRGKWLSGLLDAHTTQNMCCTNAHTVSTDDLLSRTRIHIYTHTHVFACRRAPRLHKHHSIFKVLGQSFFPWQRGITSRPYTLNQPLSHPPASGPFVCVRREITRRTHTEQPWFERVNHFVRCVFLKSPHLICAPKKYRHN